jgi:hypothetical protein
MRTQPLSADRRSVKFAHAFNPCTSCGRLIDSRPVEEVSIGRQSGPATFALHRSAPIAGVRAFGQEEETLVLTLRITRMGMAHA